MKLIYSHVAPFMTVTNFQELRVPVQDNGKIKLLVYECGKNKLMW